MRRNYSWTNANEFTGRLEIFFAFEGRLFEFSSFILPEAKVGSSGKCQDYSDANATGKWTQDAQFSTEIVNSELKEMGIENQ